MDAILAFSAGMLFSWWFWPILFIASLAFESFERNGLAVFTAILTGLGIYGFFGIGDWGFFSLMVFGGGYIGSGFLHAIWRWYRYVDHTVEKFNKVLPELKSDAIGEANSITTHTAKDRLQNRVNEHKEKTDYRNRLDTIAYWVLMWPISGLSHLFGDIVRLIQKTISTVFSGLFDRITNRANDKLTIDLDNPLGLSEVELAQRI